MYYLNYKYFTYIETFFIKALNDYIPKRNY